MSKPVILSEAKDLGYTEILRFAQDDEWVDLSIDFEIIGSQCSGARCECYLAPRAYL